MLSGSTSEGTAIEQITSCVCPTIFWPKPLGCKEIVRKEAKLKINIQ